MEHIAKSIGEVRNNWKKYISMILESPDLCVMVTRRLNQHVASSDKRFLCVLSGEKYLEMYKAAYGEEAEKELRSRMCEITEDENLFGDDEN